MTATYTFDVFSSLDGYGSHSGNWGGYWGLLGAKVRSLPQQFVLHGSDRIEPTKR